MTPNREAFEQVCKEVECGIPLNLCHLHDIFGKDVFVLMTLALSSAKEQDLDYLNLLRRVVREEMSANPSAHRMRAFIQRVWRKIHKGSVSSGPTATAGT